MKRNEDVSWSEDRKQSSSSKPSILSKLQYVLLGVAFALAILICVNVIRGGNRHNDSSESTPKVTESAITPTTKPSSTPSPSSGPSPSPTPSPVISLNIGDVVLFGEFDQDDDSANGKEPIKWIVLDESGDEILLLSQKGLDCRNYNTDDEKITWEKCDLRGWLNGDFYDEAFDSTQKVSIQLTCVEAEKNKDHPNVEAGEDTYDYVFILSASQADEYSRKVNMKCEPTQTAKANGAGVTNGYSWWWLRTPGKWPAWALFETSSGTHDMEGRSVTTEYGVVRPALWVKKDAVSVVD